MTKNYRLSLLVEVVIALSASSAHAATTFDLIDLGVLPGGVSSTATSVDNAGEVVGYTTFADNTTEAFYWTQAGGMVGLGGVNSKAFGVNNGNVVGITGNRAFRWTSGSGVVVVDSTHLGQLNGVNGAGFAVGMRNLLGSGRATVVSPTNVVTLPLQFTDSTGLAINSSNQIVGSEPNGGIGFYYDVPSSAFTNLGSFFPKSLSDNRIASGSVGGVASLHDIALNLTTSIGTLSGDLTSNGLGINPLGSGIVGVSNGHGGFLYDVATANLASLTSLLAPAQSGWSVLSGNAINDQGHIAATATFAGVQHAVLLVPEPSTISLGCLGLLGFACVVRRRR